MGQQPDYFTVFEHDLLRVNHPDPRRCISEPQRKILEDYYGAGNPYFSLIHNGVKFNEYVGVLQAGMLTIEVLPKADRAGEKATDNTRIWQGFLMDMLRAAGMLPETTGYAGLKLRHHSILDVYMLLFLKEARYLMQTGLVRQYRKEESNTLSLKGSLQFAQNIAHNLTHAERFYTRHTVYDRDHVYNAVLRQALVLIARIAVLPSIKADAQAMLLDFPDCSEVKITEALFQRMLYGRKTEAYRPAHNIARLLLLNYHPDIRRGSANVLALMFNMNLLWEKYVFRMLRRALQQQYPGTYLLREQVHTNFWQPDTGYMRTVKPDIIVFKADESNKAVLVLDTKWKRIPDGRPGDDDLKQMLVYNLFHDCKHSLLVYPERESRKGVGGLYQAMPGSTCATFFLQLLEANGAIILDIASLVTAIVDSPTLGGSN